MTPEEERLIRKRAEQHADDLVVIEKHPGGKR